MELEQTAGDLLERHGVPGVAIGFGDGSGTARIVTAGSCGDGLGPVEDDTVFAAASLSKPVFATGVLALVGDGRLELDRPLREYVAEPYLASDERAASITARMVLAHTTGFPNWRRDGSLILRWSPGTRWGYSGEGCSYLQQVVEHLTGTRLDRFLSEAVLRPLGMHDSTFAHADADDRRIARGHAADGNPWPPFRPPHAKAAAGGMFTTAPDYLRFLLHSLAGDQRVFEPQARIDDELGWGLGWGIEHGDGGRAVWQWGDDPGYKNFVIGRPADRRGTVVLTNGDRGAAVYSELVRHLLPGAHPALDVWEHPAWVDSWTQPAAGD